MIALFAMQLLQNASLTLLARARNSSSLSFHALATVLAQVLSLLILRQVVTNLDSWPFLASQVGGALVGNLTMHHFSMRYIERSKKREES